MPRTAALFIPCFVDQLAPQVGLDTVKVLRRIGWDVVYPEAQTCCGQPPFNAGFWDDARPCAEKFLRDFEGHEFIVCPSGSCTSMVRHEYPELLAGSPLVEQARAIGARTFEFSEFLVKIAGVTDVGATFPHSVTYHASCHATRLLGIRTEPLELLRRVRGLDLREMVYADECCGFGGTFAIKMGSISAAMADTKAMNASETGAEYVASIDPSCLMHLDGRFRLTAQKPRTIHLASILASEAR